MRNLSELLRICSKYNVHFGGVLKGMCTCATAAHERGEITREERNLVWEECEVLVDELSPGSNYLSISLRERFNVGDVSEAVRQIYGAWIDRLETGHVEEDEELVYENTWL